MYGTLRVNKEGIVTCNSQQNIARGRDWNFNKPTNKIDGLRRININERISNPITGHCHFLTLAFNAASAMLSSGLKALVESLAASSRRASFDIDVFYFGSLA